MKKYMLLLTLFAYRDFVNGQIPVADLQGWYKADAGVATSPFFTWADQSVHHNVLDPGFSMYQPSEETDAGGKKFIRFPRYADQTFPFPVEGVTEISSASSSWSSASTGLTILVVHKSNDYVLSGITGGIELTASGLFSLPASSTTAGQVSFVGDCSNNLFATSSGKQIVSATFIPSSATGNKVYVNGSLVSTASTAGCSYAPGSTAFLKFTSSAISIGSNLDIYEAIVYSAALSATDRQQAESYLAGKYGISLPLTLISFSGTKENETVLLEWKTENEENISHFEIERSSDGRAFEKAGIVTGRNSAGLHTYSFSDNTIWNSDTRFYKIKMVDLDGKFTCSKIIRLTNSTTKSLIVFPNPAKDIITISGLSGKGEIKLVNTEGKEWIRQAVTAQSQTLNINTLPKGIYFLLYDDNGKTVKQKILKE